MEVINTPLEGLKVIQLKVYNDNRGFFIERFQEEKFKELGLPYKFVQDNHSRSKPGVVRGLHGQYDPGQGKLVGVIRGKIYDVAVDARPNSPTYGQHFGIDLSDENGKLLWIPTGFFHGFSTYEESDVFYKVDNLYNPKSEIGIIWDDKDININWHVQNPIVSDKDKLLMSFSEYKKNPVKW